MTDSSETMPLVFSAPGRDLDPPRYGHELCEGDGRLAEAHGQRLEPGDAFRGLLLRYSLAHGGVGSDAQERSLEGGRAGRGLGSLSVGVFRDGPDGDASGSTLAAWHALTALGKRAVVCLPGGIPRMYMGMPGSGRVLETGAPLPFEPKAALAVDVSDLPRLGEAASVAGEAISISSM